MVPNGGAYGSSSTQRYYRYELLMSKGDEEGEAKTMRRNQGLDETSFSETQKLRVKAWS